MRPSHRHPSARRKLRRQGVGVGVWSRKSCGRGHPENENYRGIIGEGVSPDNKNQRIGIIGGWGPPIIPRSPLISGDRGKTVLGGGWVQPRGCGVAGDVRRSARGAFGVVWACRPARHIRDPSPRGWPPRGRRAGLRSSASVVAPLCRPRSGHAASAGRQARPRIISTPAAAIFWPALDSGGSDSVSGLVGRELGTLGGQI